jgi:hypothetical protein
MNQVELSHVLDELFEAFPYVKKRLLESPRSLQEWQYRLRPLAADLVSDGIGRWLRSHNQDPTLDQFLELLDIMAAERQYRAARAPVPFEQVAGVSADRVPVAEVQALLAPLYAKFDENTRRMETARQERAGQEANPRHFYRNGMQGPIPGWNPELPMPLLAEDEPA